MTRQEYDQRYCTPEDFHFVCNSMVPEFWPAETAAQIIANYDRERAALKSESESDTKTTQGSNIGTESCDAAVSPVPPGVFRQGESKGD